jgi:hypothetical protein
MAVIPTYTRQSGIPSTTGVSAAPVVTINNQVAQATANFFQQTGKVGDKLFAAQASSELTTATTNAQLKLVQLETDLAKQPGISALGAFNIRSAQIYNDATKTMHPDTRLEFDKKWGLLSTKTQVSVQATATKRAYSQMAGDLTDNLDALARGIGLNGNPVDSDMAMTSGIAAINLAVLKNIITPKAGADLRIKFSGDIAKNGISAWINGTSKENLLGAYDQMDIGKFTKGSAKENKRNAANWAQLGELEKEAVRQRLAQEIKSIQAQKDKEERDVAKVKKEDQENRAGDIANLIQSVAIGQKDRELLPSLYDLYTMKKNREIDGDQLKSLGALLVDIDKAKTEESTLLGLQNDIYDIAEMPEGAEKKDALKAINKRMVGLSSIGSLEATHATGLNNLIAKVKDTGFKNSARVRARVSLKRILGATDPEFKIGGYDLDPQAAGRIQRFLNEYEDRVEDGEKPWDLHKEMIRRAQIEIPSVKSIPRPILGPAIPLDQWTDKHVTEADEALVLGLMEKKITNGAFNASIGYLQAIRSILAQKAALEKAENTAPDGSKDTDKEVERRKKR